MKDLRLSISHISSPGSRVTAKGPVDEVAAMGLRVHPSTPDKTLSDPYQALVASLPQPIQLHKTSLFAKPCER